MPEIHLLDSENTICEEIRHSCLIRANRQACFRTLTTAEGWNAWFTASMFLDLKPGGVIIFEWKDWGANNFSGGDHGAILEVKEGQQLSFTWHPDRPDYATRVDITLEDAPDGCLVHVSEFGFSDDDEGLHSMLQSAAGWGEALTLLTMYLEHGLKY